MTDRIAELERRIEFWRKGNIADQRSIDERNAEIAEAEAELARLKEPEWEEVGRQDSDETIRFIQGGSDWAHRLHRTLVTFIERRAVDRYKRDQADAVGALRAVLDGTPGSHDRARATLRAIDEGK